MKVEFDQHFSYPWPIVARSVFFKKQDPRVEISVVEQKFDEETKVLFTKRQYKLENTAPFLIRKIIRSDYIYFDEESLVDEKNQRMEMNTINVSFSSLITIKESSVYFKHPENPQWTKFQQSADVNATSYCGPLKGPLERVCLGIFNKEVKNSHKVFTETLKEKFGQQLESLKDSSVLKHLMVAATALNGA